jgi:hypothetical protein
MSIAGVLLVGCAVSIAVMFISGLVALGVAVSSAIKEDAQNHCKIPIVEMEGPETCHQYLLQVGKVFLPQTSCSKSTVYFCPDDQKK